MNYINSSNRNIFIYQDWGLIGAFNTVLLIFLTAFIGIYYARLEGLHTINDGLRKMVKNQIPIYELISGGFIAIGAIFLILPGFATDIIGFLIIFPLTRNIIFKMISKKYKKRISKIKILLREIIKI